jgi:sporulation integral membrane protein YtvI
LGVLLSIISAFFFIKDNRQIYRSFVNLTPGWLSENVSLIKKSLLSALGGYYRAQILIGCIVGTMCMTGLAILRYPYALFLGFIIIVLDTLPMVGCGAVFWPWIVMSMITGDYARAVGLLVIYSIVFVTRQMIEPRILGKQIGVHPLLTLMSMYIGLKVFGVLGVIIGPIIITTVKVILDTDITISRRTAS